MQELVTDNINDLDFLKLALKIEIEKIKDNIESLIRFKEVQNYISLIKRKDILKKNNLYKDPIKAELKDKIEKLISYFNEVKQYRDSLEALEDYQKKLEKLNNLISINGIIYNKEREDKIFYFPKQALKHLLSIKESKSLPLETTIEELNSYINIVRVNLKDKTHYEDDKEIDQILSYKIYENPSNYDIKNIETLPLIRTNDLEKNSQLTKREQEAFYGVDAYKILGLEKETTKVKRIGEKKDV